ncbi:hypothetical protein R3P38DRAFT_3288650 [Favolaschia claudopus]|uniref:Uncharacterized protein n=1 Tax=Favolaschia claudopus TaxID=2862362 RepID=A0AAV9ZVL2_9AGAR
MHFDCCVLSASHCHEAGPAAFTYDDPEDIAELAQELAKEITPKLEPELSFESIQTILQESLQLFSEDLYSWLLEYTGRKTYYVKEDNFYCTGVLICVQKRRNRSRDGGKPSLRNTTMGRKSWLRSSSTALSCLDDSAFAAKFFRLVDSDHDDCVHRDNISDLLPCVSYGAIENTQEESEQELLRSVRTSSVNIASAIAAGNRGRELWPAMAADFGAWMVTRPDIWPGLPQSNPLGAPL